MARGRDRVPQPVRITGLYVTVSLAWILLSDAAVTLLFRDPSRIQLASTLKGWAYVAIVALGLYVLLENDRRRYDRVAAERAAVEQRMTRMLDGLAAAVLFVDSSGRVAYANRSAARLAGLSAEGASPSAFSSLAWRFDDGRGSKMRLDDLPAVRAALSGESVAAAGAVSFERTDGERAWVALSAEPWEEPLLGSGALVAMTDVTVQIVATTRLERLNRLYAVLGEVSRLIVALPEGPDILSEVCRIVTTTAGFSMAWIGMRNEDDDVISVASGGEVGGYLDGIVVTARDEPSGRGPIGTAIRTGEPCVVNDIRGEEEFAPWRERALERGYRACAAFPLRLGSEVVGAFGVYATACGVFGDDEVALLVQLADYVSFSLEYAKSRRERSELDVEVEKHRAHLEELVSDRTAELKDLNERLTQATIAKSQFLANMSHELRTPLNSIIGFTGVMMQGLAGPLGDEQRRQVEMVNHSGRYLLTLINDVLDLSRIEAGRVAVEVDEFDALRVLNDVVSVMRPLADEKGLALNADFPNGRIAMRSDESKVQQIVTNLVANAIKFTEHGAVTVAASVDAGRMLDIRVTDTGVGVDRGEIERIFEEFHQAPQPSEAKPEGTGLGLTISRRLAELLGGTITVDSTPGDGASFSVRLPMRIRGW